MKQCSCCHMEYDETIAMGVCPFCGTLEESDNDESLEVESETVLLFNNNEDEEDDPNRRKQKYDQRWLPKGTMLHGRYEVLYVLGAGGFGITYKVWDHVSGTYRAVKEYFQLFAANRIPGTKKVFIIASKEEEFLWGKDRFTTESTKVAKFQSDCIVRVHEHFFENDTVYMVMEYLSALTLENFLKKNERTLTEEEAVKIGSNLCDALTEIHSVGMIHRDVAPDNIFVLDDGRVKIIDFGSARLSTDDIEDKVISIKAGYSAPEQYEKIDLNDDRQKGWTDVYSLGATLYAAVTGQKPVEASERKEALENGKDSLEDAKVLNPYISDRLNNVIMTALAIDIHERFQTAEDFKKALVGDVNVEHPNVVRKKKRIRRTAGIVGGFILAAGVVTAGIITYMTRNPALEKATVTLWYSADEKGQKATIYEDLKAELAETDVFQNVTIDLKGIPEDTYEDELEKAYKAGEMPILYEVSDNQADYQNDAIILKGELDSDELNECYFLNKKMDTLSDEKAVPTGFNIPVVYINKTILKNKDKSLDDAFFNSFTISSMSDLLSLCDGEVTYMPIAIDSEMEHSYEVQFDDFSLEKLDVCTPEEFLNGRAVAYFSSTAKYSEYVKAGATGAGEFAIIPVKDSKILCQFSNYWSISECEKNEKIAAEELLGLFYSENMQVTYYVESDMQGLPVQNNAVERFKKVVPRLSSLLDDMDCYYFE